jgi:hypothetical protein
MMYLIDEDQLVKLRQIADRLQSGSDKERDEGHRLWLLIKEISDQKA